MKHTLLFVFALAALTACKEEETSATGDTDTGTVATTQESASSSGTENTATADDGGGAMAGASSTENTATADDGGGAMAGAANQSEVSQDAIDGCIDMLRGMEGSTGGTVVSTEFSEANSLVMLEDAEGNTWKCIVSNDGSNANVEAAGGTAAGENTATADDGGGAMAGAPATENTETADDGAGAMSGASETPAPSIGSPSDVSDFVGAPAGQAVGGLEALGFKVMRTEGLTTFWFNRETGACARITTSDGRFSEVVMLPAEDC